MPKPAPTAAPAKKPSALSISQMLHLMRLEMDRAMQHDYAISCIMIGLDGYEGVELLKQRQRLMPAIFQELKKVTFREKVRGLGLALDHVVIAIFPHLLPERTAALAELLLARARVLEIEGVTERQPVTLSIGVGHNQHPPPMSFEILVEEAETSLSLARSGGGDRCVQLVQVESELTRLRDELQAQIREIQDEQGHLSEEHSAAADDWGRGLSRRIVDVFEEEPESSPGVVRLQKLVIAIVKEEIAAWQDSDIVKQLFESEGMVAQLERRIRKLTGSLQDTENELRRVAALKVQETGLASIYQSVQGLNADEESYEQKKEMLKGIFAANLSLQKGGVAKD